MRVLSSVTCSWLFSVRTLASARRASSSACSDLRRAPRKASSSILALARRNLSSAIFSSGTSLALAPTAWAWAMARSVRRICSFGAGSVAQPASASTARAANRGRILTKKSLRFWGADRLQLPLPTLQIALQRGFGQAGGGQFCHLFRQLSAQPGGIAARIVGNGKKQTGLIDRLRMGLEVVGHAQGLGALFKKKPGQKAGFFYKPSRWIRPASRTRVRLRTGLPPGRNRPPGRSVRLRPC